MPNRSLALSALVPVACGLAGACGSSVELPPAPGADPQCTAIEAMTDASIDKIDVLLAIDNSRSMADQQAILALAVPDLVDRLVNPLCLEASGAPAAAQPAGPTEACPSGSRREIEPILDIHIGVISSSIGSAGGPACVASAGKSASVDDHAHLLSRLAPDTSASAPSYAGKGFLAWDPTGKLVGDDGTPQPGESDRESLIGTLTDMVVGVGQVGCGYEAQLESWYRFLVDTEPYASLDLVNGKATPIGVDEVLLAQRAEFLRPDSLLAILMLTDENDCSIRESGQYFFAAQLEDGSAPYHLPRARSECASDPNDPCCKSCGQDPGVCPVDPACDLPLSPLDDAASLRCWDQKRRFGIDFLYPVDRYVSALRDPQVANRSGELVSNPIFSDLNAQDDLSNIRDPGLVFFAGIVGVPWQDIARDPSDLTKGFKGSEELLMPDSNGWTTWDQILGDPAAYVPPKDPLMVESILPRSGTNPTTGDPTAPPGSPNQTNPINGHERTIVGQDDLQYACVFPLLPGTERDCGPNSAYESDGIDGACACALATNDDPLCEPNPLDEAKPTLQVRAKAYPSLRELAVLRGAGSQGVVASVCPAQLADQTAADFGYRPAIGAILDRLKSSIDGTCMPRALATGADGRVQCTLVEARRAGPHCACDPARGRSAVAEEHACMVESAKQSAFAQAAGWDCFCEIDQLAGAELEACQNDPDPAPMSNGETVDGWCYVDATTAPPIGNPEVVELCPESNRRTFRFVGGGELEQNATVFVHCAP